MKILAFLQNMWFKDPAAAQAIFDRHPDKRNNLVAKFLFMGGLSGKRLREALGDDMCDKIIWEETSPVLGAHSGSRYAADLGHMKAALDQHDPDLILGFGKIAETALGQLNWIYRPRYLGKILCAPHPAARGNSMAALREFARKIREYQ